VDERKATAQIGYRSPTTDYACGRVAQALEASATNRHLFRGQSAEATSGGADTVSLNKPADGHGTLILDAGTGGKRMTGPAASTPT
jgi:hypothetical protein